MSGIKGRSGRRPKDIDQEIIQRLSVLDDLFFERLEDALNNGEVYAMRIFANHRLPKQREVKEIEVAELPIFYLDTDD
tara:strand:- start:901 stop:1134 length:234 start_codon:yes stop_codon:yes gene_type:complete